MLGLRLMLMLLLLLVLHFLGVRLTPTMAPQLHLPERCKYLKNTSATMYQKCKGKFPLVAYTKFRDTFMKQTDRMALYMPNDFDHVMVALKESELHECKSIQLIEVNEYLCQDNSGGKRTIRLSRARMFCFPFHIQLTDDLMHECILERDGVTRSVEETSVLRTKRGIIHYTFDNSLAIRHRFTKQMSMFLAIFTFAMLLYT